MGGGGEGEVLHRPSPSALFGHPAFTHVFGRVGIAGPDCRVSAGPGRHPDLGHACAPAESST